MNWKEKSKLSFLVFVGKSSERADHHSVAENDDVEVSGGRASLWLSSRSVAEISNFRHVYSLPLAPCTLHLAPHSPYGESGPEKGGLISSDR